MISADSHITEPPDTYVDHIDPKFARPGPAHRSRREDVGDIFVIDGMKRPMPMGLVAAAGKPAGGDPRTPARGSRTCTAAAGTRTPASPTRTATACPAEVIYPTVGMVLCNHPDFDYKKACLDAYNRWIAEYCSRHPDRLLGCGQTAMRSPEEGIADLERIKAMGLRGVMMPGDPAVEDYDSPDLRRVLGGGDRARAAAVVPHPHHT